MKAWLNDEKLKRHFVGRLEEHRRLEHLTQGVGWEKDGGIKGCNIGCLFEHYNHARGEKESGIPEAVLRLADAIFEGLPKKEAEEFALTWPKAIKVGADLSRLKWQFCAFLMRENIERVLTLKIPDALKKEVVGEIRKVLVLNENALKTGDAKRADQTEDWSAAAASNWATAAAARAANWAAKSAAEAAESAALAAAGVANLAAAAAARASKSAAWAAKSVESASEADSAARAAYARYAKKFIRLCSETA